MNSDIDATNRHLSAARATSQARINGFAATDAKAPPPQADQKYAGKKAIAHAFKGALDAYPYFRKQTAAALFMMLLFGVVAVAVPLLFGLNMMTIGITIFSTGAATISGYYWWFHKYGPSLITQERFETAKRELHASGDLHTPPLSLLSLLTLLAIMLVDGFLSGSSLTNSVFANLFTPRWAMVAAVGWSIGVTYLLYKVIMMSALEATINERRTIIRNLSKSSAADDRQHATAMKAAVGGRLLNDFDTRANSYSARIGLVVAVLLLAGATFILRTSQEPTTDSAPPAQAQPAVLRT